MNRAARTGLAVSVVSAVLFSGFFFAAHADHDCRGEDCSLCLLARGRPEPPCAWPSREAPAFPLLKAIVLAHPLFYAVPASSVRLKVRINR